MGIRCQAELDFMTDILRRLRLQVNLIRPQDSLTVLDSGLRGILGRQADYDTALNVALEWSRKQTIYKIVDSFMCNYIYFQLTGSSEPTAVVVGPYLTIDPTREMLLEQTERLGLHIQSLKDQEEFYASLPIFSDPATILAVVSCFGEKLWGSGDAFQIVDVNYEKISSMLNLRSMDAAAEQEDVLQRMQKMEERYAYENELMDIVSRGLTHRAEVMMSSVSQLNYQMRSADPLRNIKNYCIICSTLLRKAAERGGVHPMHLDELSSQYARQIENVRTIRDGQTQIVTMIRGYSRLVRTHSGQNLSAVVQRTKAYIDANLSGELSPARLASMMNLSASYLSTIFRRETGETLTGYTIACRMRAALQLLQSTRLQVQTIAQMCGCTDPNYFARLFKRHYGMTPLEARKSQSVPLGQNP